MSDQDKLDVAEAKISVLTDHFVKFRERAVQFAPVLCPSSEYNELRKLLASPVELHAAAVARVAALRNFAANPASGTRAKAPAPSEDEEDDPREAAG